MMLLALAVSLADCVPARWPFADAQSLELLNNSPVNCLIVGNDFKAAKEAEERGLRVLTSTDFLAATRATMKLDAAGEVTGTTQALWPGIRLQKEGAIHAGPTGAAWIDTNGGFLRFVRALLPRETALWVGNRPPTDIVLGPQRYIQAIGDAAISGARWVLAFDPAFEKALTARDKRALEDWARINSVLRFYEDNRRWWDAPDLSSLAVIQDTSAGALATGGIMDMIVSKHIPVEVVTPAHLAVAQFVDVQMLLNLDPSLLDDEQKRRVSEIARRGATVLSGPPGWKMTQPAGDGYTFNDEQVKQLGEIWREVNGILGRRNFGVRLFNAATMLANLKTPDRGKTAALLLVNYSDYPVEDNTVQVAGPYKTAKLLTPRGPRAVDVFPVEDGLDITIKHLDDVAILVLE